MKISGITNFNRSVNVRPRPAVNNFSDVLKSASTKDTFTAADVWEETLEKSAVSEYSATQAKLDDISAAIKNTDYSGMTKAEIYADIENRYVDVFEDFHMTMAFAACEDHIMIHDQFLNDIHSNNAGKASPALINEARGYAGMSFDEIENAIKEKYTGKTGFVDQLNLFGELFSTGVLSNKYGVRDSIFMAMQLSTSVECGGELSMSRNEWLSRIEEAGASSPFSLLLNNPYFAHYKDKFQPMVDDILFGIIDKEN